MVQRLDLVNPRSDLVQSLQAHLLVQVEGVRVVLQPLLDLGVAENPVRKGELPQSLLCPWVRRPQLRAAAKRPELKRPCVNLGLKYPVDTIG